MCVCVCVCVRVRVCLSVCVCAPAPEGINNQWDDIDPDTTVINKVDGLSNTVRHGCLAKK